MKALVCGLILVFAWPAHGQRCANCTTQLLQIQQQLNQLNETVGQIAGRQARNEELISQALANANIAAQKASANAESIAYIEGVGGGFAALFTLLQVLGLVRRPQRPPAAGVHTHHRREDPHPKANAAGMG